MSVSIFRLKSRFLVAVLKVPPSPSYSPLDMLSLSEILSHYPAFLPLLSTKALAPEPRNFGVKFCSVLCFNYLKKKAGTLSSFCFPRSGSEILGTH